MVASDEAAFRLLEISAILFPLLFIVIQFFSRLLLSDRDIQVTETAGFARYIVYASLLLLVTVAMASTELIGAGYSYRIIIAVISLYVVFVILGYTAAVIGEALARSVEAEAQQLDLTTLVDEVQSPREDDEPQEP